MIQETNTVQLAGVVEYPDCISAETCTPNKCLRYDSKLSDGRALGNVEYPFITITPRPTLKGCCRTRAVAQSSDNWVALVD